MYFVKNYAVQITEIPYEHPAKSLNVLIRNELEVEYGTGIVSVYTVPQLVNAYKSYTELMKCKQQLLYLKHDFNKTNIRPFIRVNIWQKVDGIEYYEKNRKVQQG